MIKPILTEKSMSEAKRGRYTFLVGRDMDKKAVKKTVEAVYDVEVVSVATINLRAGSKRNSRGEKARISARKKAMVTLKGDKKIDVFEEKKGK